MVNKDEYYFPLLAHNAFVSMNRRAIATTFVHLSVCHLSVWDRGALWSYGTL